MFEDVGGFVDEIVKNWIWVDEGDRILIGSIVCLWVWFDNVCGV